MDTTEQIDALRRAILEDATSSARAEIEQARQWVAQLRAKAEQEARIESEKAIHDAEREAELIYRRILSMAEVESKRRRFEVRERLLDEVLDRASRALQSGERPHARRESLMALVTEAARELGGGRLVVRAASIDIGLLTPSFLREAEMKLKESGVSAELEVLDQPANIIGGAVLVKDGGRIVADNSYDARLRRLKPVLRNGIWQTLLGSSVQVPIE